MPASPIPSASPVKLINFLNEAVDWLKKGNLLVFPTETFYALGCISINEEAIRSIFRLKGRPYEKPLPILASDEENAEKIVYFSDNSQNLRKIFWPGPLSILCPARLHMPALLQNEGGKIAVRVTSNKEAAKLAHDAGYPLVSTSANLSGEAPVSDINEFSGSFLKRLNNSVLPVAVAAWPPAAVFKKPSTLVDIQTVGKLLLLREGQISREELKRNKFFVME